MPIPFIDLMKFTPECNCCHQRVTRIILADTVWNESGSYLFHCLVSGKITPIEEISTVVLGGRQEPE